MESALKSPVVPAAAKQVRPPADGHEHIVSASAPDMTTAERTSAGALPVVTASAAKPCGSSSFPGSQGARLRALRNIYSLCAELEE
jgi:hypothetical protein